MSLGQVSGAGDVPLFLGLFTRHTVSECIYPPFLPCIDQTFPETATVPVRGAVVLCYDLFSVCRAGTALTNSSVRDSLVFSEKQQLLSSLLTARGRQITPAVR